MSYYMRVGDVPRKRHIWHRDADGHRLPEELLGEEGFSGPSSLLYHRHSPSAITGVEPVHSDRAPLSPNDPLLPWRLQAPDLPGGGDPVTSRQVLLGNATLTIGWLDADRSSELYRNAAGDELVYIHAGSATLESVFGVIDVGAGDYVVIPRSTTHRWVLPADSRLQALVLEATGHIAVPSHYMTTTNRLRERAPFSERDLRPPRRPY